MRIRTMKGRILVMVIFLLILVTIAISQDDARVERMTAYADALGVGCDYCHLEGNYKKQTRNIKVTLVMENWVKMLRKKSDKKKVTCNDCHQGKAKILTDDNKDKGKK